MANGKDPGVKKKTRHQRNQRRASMSGESVGVNAPVGMSQFAQASNEPMRIQPMQGQSLKHDLTLFLVLHSMLGLLCLLNLFLIFKIWGLEDKISRREDVSIFPDPDEQQPDSSRYWVEILHNQELLHNQDLASWRAAVETAAKLLKQTEHSFLSLAQVIMHF
jgi:hypothetical protein